MTKPKRNREKRRKLGEAKDVPQIVVAPVVPRRLKARTLTGRSEDGDDGANGIRLMQQAILTDGRPAFDRFDAMAKPREAELFRQEGQTLLTPPEGRVLRGSSEAIVPDIAPGNGLPVEQRSREIDIIDTLENPSMIGLGASQLRMEAVQRLGILQPAHDAAQTAQAANSLEKMLCHQMTACHFAAMNLLQRAMEGNSLMQDQDAAVVTRYTNAAARMMDTYQAGMLALLKFKTGGKQTVVVQHVHVSDGGQAVIAGNVTKEGGSGTGGGAST